jgi:transcriptional regulator with XRE-family HTH domain
MPEDRQVSLNAPTNEELEQTPGQPPEKAQVKRVDIDPAPSVQEGPVPAKEFQELESADIGSLLRDLRGRLSLRQLEKATGITYSYLSNIERGNRRPGFKILSKLAVYHDVPMRDLLAAAGYPPEPAEDGRHTIADIQRSFRFVIEDPELEVFEKPSEAAPIDLKRYLVQLYEHYTGRKLLDRERNA